MTAEREKELFDKYLNSRYNQLIQKAHTNAVWELNGRKMPKKTRVLKLKEDGRFPALVEKYKKECDTLHIIELKNGDMRSEFVEKSELRGNKFPSFLRNRVTFSGMLCYC